MTGITNDLESDEELDEHVKPKVISPDIFSFKVSEPESDLLPDHDPVAEQLDAFDTDQFNWISSPSKGSERLDENVILMGGIVTATGTGAGADPPPPPPPQEIKITDARNNK